MRYQPITDTEEAAALSAARRQRKNFGGVCVACRKLVAANNVEIAYVVNGAVQRDRTDGAEAVVIGRNCRSRLAR